ncbi:MAG TPA: O-antigen ligase family protein [Devosia sp.]|nr:O-antigen ligase family protein [Devosia sp.]
MASLRPLALWAVLLLPLVLSPLTGLLTPYVALLVIVPLFAATMVRGRAADAYSSYAARAFVVVFAVLAALFVATADGVSDALMAFNFTMLLCYGAIAYLLGQGAAERNAERVAQLAGLGVLIGFLEVLAEAAMGSPRPSAINLGPIVLSNGLIALGLLSLGGALVRKDRWAWLYAVPPVLAIVATALTGSRGPLLALPVSAVVSVVVFWRVRLPHTPRTVMTGLVGLVLVAGAALLLILNGRAASLFRVVDTIATGGDVADSSTLRRFALYRAGWSSFLESPWIGHGWGNIMQSVRPLLAPADADVGTLPQLHNDVLNFAVAGGIVGIGCWLAIISAPLIGAWLSPRDSLRTFRLYGATMLTLTYLGGGLTDLMFGFEFHTFLFVMLTAILLAYCREGEAVR